MRRVVRKCLLHLREGGVSWGFFVFQLSFLLLDCIFILRVSYVSVKKKFTKVGIFGDRMDLL